MVASGAGGAVNAAESASSTPVPMLAPTPAPAPYHLQQIANCALQIASLRADAPMLRRNTFALLHELMASTRDRRFFSFTCVALWRCSERRHALMCARKLTPRSPTCFAHCFLPV